MGMAMQIFQTFGPMVNCDQVMLGMHSHSGHVGAAIVVPLVQAIPGKQGIHGSIGDIPKFPHALAQFLDLFWCRFCRKPSAF